MIDYRRTNSADPAFQSLVALLDKELRDEYQELQNYYSQFNKVPDLQTVVVAFAGDEAVGCGCFKPFDKDSVEIKRMYVTPGHRGTGVAAGILNALERWALELSYSYAVLETGNKQLAAIQFYKRQGYQVTENYGQYIGLPTSICMRKSINNNALLSAPQ